MEAFDPTIVVDLETVGHTGRESCLWPCLIIRILSNLGEHETVLYSNVDRPPWWPPAIANGSMFASLAWRIGEDPDRGCSHQLIVAV